MASNGDRPASARTPKKFQELKQKLEELKKEKADWQEGIKDWEDEKALRQRQLADLTGPDEVLRAQVERRGWTRKELEENMQLAENRLHSSQQRALRAEAALAATAAALLHQDADSNPSPYEAGTSPTPQALFESDEQLYSKALDKGNVDVESSDSVIVGVAGSGKTLSLAMAIEEEPPSERESTPCAKAPVRAIAQKRVGVQEKKLRMVGHHQLFNMAMRTIKVAAHSIHSYTPTPCHVSAVDPNTPSYMCGLEQVMIRCVKEEEISSDLLCEFRLKKITDSGGQPQFLEVLPIFIHHISLGIITVKLNERLDYRPMVQFYKDGQPLGDSYMSHYTHEQIIRHCMRGLISQGQGKLGIKFLFLGTHLDLVEDSKGESLQDKNRKLKEMVAFFKMEENVVYCNNSFDLLYAINAKNPGPSDWEVMKQVREVIAESSNEPPIRFPIKWYVLELALMLHIYVTEQSVLLESECLQLVKIFRFDESSLKAALRYLHQAKFIFYYEEGHLVYVSIQFVLNKLSEIVCYSIRLCSNPKESARLDKMWKKFRYYGILHLSCLDKFPEGYIEGVFSPKELMQLFIHLCIVSEVGPEEYLMPCLLVAEEEACCNPEPETQAVPPMALEFPEGGPMLGSFCGLVCYLMSAQGWKLVEDATKQPHHLTRSSIHFLVPKGLPGKITINDPLSTFLLVTFHGNPKVASKMCPLVRETVLVALKEVSKTLNYFPRDTSKTNSLVNKPHVTFLCPCKGSPLHPAVMSDCGEFLSCPHQPLLSEDVTEKHRIWFGGDIQALPLHGCTPSSGCEVVSYVASLPATALSYLDNQLDWDQQGVATHLNQIAESMVGWEEKLSTKLGLTDVQIHDLKKEHPKPILLRRAVLRVWQSQQGLQATYRNLLQLCCEGEHSRSAETICRLLREKAAEEPANEVQSKVTFENQLEIAPSAPSQSTPLAQTEVTPTLCTEAVTADNQPSPPEPMDSQSSNQQHLPSASPPLRGVTPPALPTPTVLPGATPPPHPPSQPPTLASSFPRLTSSDPSSWSVEDVCSWLTSQGLKKCVEIFRENEVDGECLLSMDHELLKDGLGIKALPHRSIILKKIKELKK